MVSDFDGITPHHTDIIGQHLPKKKKKKEKESFTAHTSQKCTLEAGELDGNTDLFQLKQKGELLQYH